MQLRDYQQDAIAGVRQAFSAGHSRVLLVAPTGAGKTVMFSYLAGSIAARGQRVLLMAHRDELLDQIGRTLAQFGVEHGFIAARRALNLEVPVQVAGVHTLKNRASRLAWRPDWIICDEAHHATAGSWAAILRAYPHARVLGVTATPERLDGKGLGNVFDSMVRGPEVADLIQRGFLSPIRYYCPRTVDTDGMRLRMGDYRTADVDQRVNNARVTGEAVDWYRKLCDGAPAVAFCASIKHSEHVAETFRAAGYRWTSLDSTMTPEARRAAVTGLGNGRLHGVSSCDIISEGFDLPIVSAAILLRPTASLGLYLQQVGRVLRISPGKTHATIIDHVGNCGSTRAGEWVEKHGFAEDVREWSLEGRTKKKGATPVRLCEQCFAVVPVGSATCPQCGTEKPPQEKQLPEAADAGDLEEVDRKEKRKKVGDEIKELLTQEYLESLNPKFNAASRCAQFMNEAKKLLPHEYNDTSCLRADLVDYMISVYSGDDFNAKYWWDQFLGKSVFHKGYKFYVKTITQDDEQKARTLEDWQRIAKLRGYNQGWAWHRHNQRTQKRTTYKIR